MQINYTQRQVLSVSRKMISLGVVLFNVVVLIWTIRLARAGGTYTSFVPFISNAPPVFISHLTRLNSISYNVRATGEVTTTSIVPLHNIRILVTMFDNSDQIVATKVDTTAFEATFQGMVNPFDIYTSTPSNQVAYITAQIVGWEMASDQGFADISILKLEVFVFHDVTRVVTTIKNNNSQPVIDVVGLAWSLEQGNSLSPFAVSGFLAPGATEVFTSTIYDVGFPGFIPEVGAAAQGILAP